MYYILSYLLFIIRVVKYDVEIDVGRCSLTIVLRLIFWPYCGETVVNLAPKYLLISVKSVLADRG